MKVQRRVDFEDGSGYEFTINVPGREDLGQLDDAGVMGALIEHLRGRRK